MTAERLPIHFAVDNSLLTGDFAYIHRLPGVPDPKMLRDLINGNQFATSGDGEHFCMVESSSYGEQRLVHSGADFSRYAFGSTNPKQAREGLRILGVYPESVKVWGWFNWVVGVFHVTCDGVCLLHELQELTSLRPTPEGLMPIGRNEKDPIGTHTALLPQGPLHLEQGAIVNVLHDGSLLVLEQINGTYYRYRVKDGLFKDWAAVYLHKGERPLDILCWNNSFLAVLRKGPCSVIRPIGLQCDNGSAVAREIVVPGVVEAAWTSPSTHSLAWLVRSTSEQEGRELYLNGDLVHEGQFTMRKQDLRWSPKGQTIAAIVTDDRWSAQSTQQVVTPNQVFTAEPGQVVQDVLVDDLGHVASVVLDDGTFHRPCVYTRKHSPVPFCWNLGWNPDGSVRYNSVFHDLVVSTTDRTEQLRR